MRRFVAFNCSALSYPRLVSMRLMGVAHYVFITRGCGMFNSPAPSRLSNARYLLVSDFDGTVTEKDFFERALAHLHAEAMPDYWEDYLVGRRSHFEALRGIFSHLRGGEEQILAIARETRFDPTFRESIEKLRSAEWDVVIASAGCDWYIDRLLREHGIQVTIVSNPGRIAEDGSLEMVSPRDSPFFSPETGIDKSAVVRWALDQFETVAFVGDGRPDEVPARQVAPACRFARGWLAGRFTSDGTPFQPFTQWSDIAEKMTA